MSLTGEPISSIESDWTYDKLGRVASQTVETSASLVAEQTLTYFGNDDPATMDQYVGSNHKTFQFGYDLRHELTYAAETTSSGYFSAAYNYGPAGRFINAYETRSGPANTEVVPRTVDYEWKSSRAFFKLERGQVNIGLGDGDALNMFNDNVLSFCVVSW